MPVGVAQKVFREAVLLPLLLIYSTLLLLAAWSKPLCPPGFRKAHRLANQFFQTIGLRAGLPLFFAVHQSPIPTFTCLQVTAVDRIGKTHLLYESDRSCEAPLIRFEDVYKLTQLRLMQRSKFKLLADYYCHSPLAGRGEPVEVTFAKHVRAINYETGRLRAGFEVLAQVDCKDPTPLMGSA